LQKHKVKVCINLVIYVNKISNIDILGVFVEEIIKVLGVASIAIGIFLIVAIIGIGAGLGIIINGIMLLAFSSVVKTVKENNEYLHKLIDSSRAESRQVNPSIAKPKEDFATSDTLRNNVERFNDKETFQKKSDTKSRKCPQCGYELGEENPSMCPQCKAFLPRY